MRKFWKLIRSNWTRTDTLVFGGNAIAFGLFIGNVWWESLAVCYTATIVPLTMQAIQCRLEKTLRSAFIFGAVVGLTWPIGEGIVVRAFGWWGQYLQNGPFIWDTGLYCALIGWLACTYLRYLYERTMQFGYSQRTAIIHVAVSALGLGAVGENLFVHARMWEYHASTWDWGAVPAFVPIAYGLSYAFLPVIKRWKAVPAALAFNGITGVLAVALGLAVRFFPR
jgi:hypothetical protein